MNITVAELASARAQGTELFYRTTMADTFAMRAPTSARRWLSVLGDSPTIEGEWLGMALRRRYGAAVEYDAEPSYAIAAE